MSETPSVVPGWYIRFQTDVLSQLPRPGEISQEQAETWGRQRSILAVKLREALCPRKLSAAEFNAWKTVSIGDEPGSERALRAAITRTKMRISSDAAEFVLSPGFFPAEKRVVDLVLVTPGDLGWSVSNDHRDVIRYIDVVNAALGMGFELCPRGVAFQLCMDEEQPEGEGRIVCIDPIFRDNKPVVLEVVHYTHGERKVHRELRLTPAGHYGRHTFSKFVFVRPRN